MHAVRWVGKSLSAEFSPSGSAVCRWLCVHGRLVSACVWVQVCFTYEAKGFGLVLLRLRIQAPVHRVMRMAAGWLLSSMCACSAGALERRCEDENVCFKLYEVQRGSQMSSIKQPRWKWEVENMPHIWVLRFSNFLFFFFLKRLIDVLRKF